MTFISLAPPGHRVDLSQVRTPAAAAAAAMAVVAILALCLLWLPGFPAGRHAQELTAILDGGYRISRGQLPHLDFVVPYGGLTLFQGWLAHRFEPVFPPFAVILASSFAMIAPLTLLIARRQASTLKAVAVVVIASAMVLVPIVVELVPVNEFNLNAVSNRNASALLFLGLVWALTPKRACSSEVALLAALLMLTFWWKAPHALAMLLVLFVHGLMSHPTRWLVIRTIILFEVLLLIIDLATRGMLRAYMADIAEMIRVNSVATFPALLALAMRNLPALVTAIAAVVVMPLWWRRASGRWFLRPFAAARSLRPALNVLIVVAAVLCVESQNAGNLGLLPALALAFGPLAPDRNRLRLALLAAVTLALLAYPYAENLLRRGTTMALHYTELYPEAAARPALSRTLVSAGQQTLADAYQALWRKPERENGHIASAIATFAHNQNPTEAAQGLAWAREVAAAAALAQASGLVTPKMRVMSVGYADPFARLLGAEPIDGGYLWLDPQSTVRNIEAAQAAMLLAGADAVFVQLCPKSPAFEAMVEGPFSSALRRGFVPAMRTNCYELWLQRHR